MITVFFPKHYDKTDCQKWIEDRMNIGGVVFSIPSVETDLPIGRGLIRTGAITAMIDDSWKYWHVRDAVSRLID